MSGKHLEEKLSLSVLPWKNTRLALEKLQNLLRCNKCQQLPLSPQYMGRCDHFFCQTCINNITESLCPICKIPSTPCERKPDIIVAGLVSSVSEMFTLINGGEVKLTKGLEAPESSMTLDNISNNISMQTTTRKTGVLRSSTGLGNQPYIKAETSIPTYTNISKAKGRPSSRLPKKIISEEKETNMTKSKSENLLTKDHEKKENTLYTKTLSVVLKPVIHTPPPAKYAKLHEHNLALTGITPTTPAINKRNVKGETPLHIACIKKDIQTIKKLLEDGANPNTKDNAGWTPLHEACSHGFEEVATLLLEHGALVDVPGSNNMTPLHDAVISETIPVISLLRKWGASETSRDIWGRTPRSIASLSKSAELIISALETSKDELLIPKSSFGPLLSKFVLLDSGLSADQKKKFETVAKLLKAKLVKDFGTEVTHIIVNCEEGSKVCQRTVKYMMGVVSGKWILSHKWLDACLSISGPANPLEFEVEGPRSNPCCLAPSKGRLNAFKMLPGLFSGCHIYFHGSFGGDLPSKKELESLVKAGDCVPLYREPNPEAISENEETVPFHTSWDGPLSRCSHYIIFAEGMHEPQLQYDMAHIKSLPISWLYQCIDEWCLSSLEK